MTARGVVARFDVTGADRLRRLEGLWKDLCGAARIDDRVGVRASGLVAFGSFAFSDASPSSSVLLVPRMLWGRRDGKGWVTRIAVDGEPLPDLPGRAATEVVSDPTDDPGTRSPLRFEPGETTRKDFEQAVARGLAMIEESPELRKLVLARDVRLHLPAGSHLITPLSRLLARFPDCWTFAVDGLLGASPETLVSIRGGEARSRVLAGSVARAADPVEDASRARTLRQSDKERTEHALAADSVVAALEPFARDVTVTGPFAWRLPDLWHLATDVSARLREDVSPLRLVEALHPTGAVAGVPRLLAQRAIALLESSDRGRYSGPVGWIASGGDAEWAIALRCARVDPSGTVTAWAGAGVVPGSVPEREFRETTVKLRAMADAFR